MKLQPDPYQIPWQGQSALRKNILVSKHSVKSSHECKSETPVGCFITFQPGKQAPKTGFTVLLQSSLLSKWANKLCDYVNLKWFG